MLKTSPPASVSFSDFLKPIEKRKGDVAYRCANGHVTNIPFAGKSINCQFMLEDNREWHEPSIVCPEEAYIEGTATDENAPPRDERPMFSGVDHTGRPMPANDAAKTAAKDPQWVREQKRRNSAA